MSFWLFSIFSSSASTSQETGRTSRKVNSFVQAGGVGDVCLIIRPPPLRPSRGIWAPWWLKQCETFRLANDRFVKCHSAGGCFHARYNLRSRSGKPFVKGAKECFIEKRLIPSAASLFLLVFTRKITLLMILALLMLLQQQKPFHWDQRRRRKVFQRLPLSFEDFFMVELFQLRKRSERFSFSDVFSRISFCFNLNFHKNEIFD